MEVSLEDGGKCVSGGQACAVSDGRGIKSIWKGIGVVEFHQSPR